MTFQQIKDEIGIRSDDILNEGTKGNWVNQAYKRVLGAYQQWPFLKAENTDTTVDGTATYNLPSDFSKPIDLWVGSTEYSRVDYEDRLNPGLNMVYYINPGQSTYTLIPAPTSSGSTITLNYISTITDLASGEDSPVFDERFHEILVYGAMERYHEREKEMSKAAFYNQQYRNLLSEAIDFYSRYGKDDVIRMQSAADIYNLDY